MRVQQILQSKPRHDVATVEPGSTIADAVAVLSARGIGAVVVSEDGKTVAGILSERDIVRGLGARGPDCLSDVVSSMMTPDPVTCRPDDLSEAVFRLMTDGRFRHLPVMDGAQMIGLISIGDVVKAQLSELAMEKTALEGMIMGY